MSGTHSRTQFTQQLEPGLPIGRFSRHSKDNALAESKNASVVRKHRGYDHIPQAYAKPINGFYQETFNPWLNLHRPCLFATLIRNAKGNLVKRYKHEEVKTPLERLLQLPAAHVIP